MVLIMMPHNTFLRRRKRPILSLKIRYWQLMQVMSLLRMNKKRVKKLILRRLMIKMNISTLLRV